MTARHYQDGKFVGIGDAISAIATPIARVLGLPCIDPQTKQLRPESGCAKRKAKLNALTRPHGQQWPTKSLSASDSITRKTGR